MMDSLGYATTVTPKAGGCRRQAPTPRLSAPFGKALLPNPLLLRLLSGIRGTKMFPPYSRRARNVAESARQVQHPPSPYHRWAWGAHLRTR